MPTSPPTVFSLKGFIMFESNLVLLRGRVTSEPTIRELPSGSTVTQLEITTRIGDANSTVPVAVHGRVVEVRPGDEVVVAGSVQRRFFRAGGVTQSRTEVIAAEIVPVTRKRAVTKLISSAMTTLGSAR